MTRDEAKAIVYNTSKVGDVYFVMDLINEIYDDFEEDMTIAYASIDKAIDALERMKISEIGEH